ncbi:MAG: deoxyribodipyrimidine photolyase [Planctomycetota bacterium]
MSRRPDVPSSRRRWLRSGEPRSGGRYVVYWMNAARRTRCNYALDRALGLAGDLEVPLVVLEALRCDYRWASDRMHRFVLQGMRDNRAVFDGTGILYHPYVEPRVGAGKGLLRALAREACAVVTDDFPDFFHPRMLAAAAEQIEVPLEAVDSNGLLPLRAADRAFARAFDLRRFLQRELRPHLLQPPRLNPVPRAKLKPLAELPAKVTRRWPRASDALLEGAPAELAKLPIDHAVGPVDLVGGEAAARRALKRFVEQRLAIYGEERSHPDSDAASGLSPYLHFGHLSAHEVLGAVAKREGWKPEQVGGIKSGARHGWWNLSEAAEAFMDELVTWRELGLNFAAHRDDIDRYGSLPEWSRRTLAEHAGDTRPHLYSHARFDAAETHDELWNAAQTELRESGRMQNYLRMLWGKKILHWSEAPEQALEVMIELNNRYALDGRDPNSYSGIFWVLGRYDRAWGPEREVFGKIRYMSGQNTRRKLRLNDYLARWGSGSLFTG